ncbi:sugar transferase [Anaerocellum danielii]|uniref:Sugar transferase n=1 Tax=Anaerocellum danielii TaxID=1387557 RepID=A0ABZ0U3M8_9FIRM|nr:sugar transferase [Caldicellulosiruptor danielii]WPX09208.1 sugar transferase [Caldicellulosiruptor danielii]
MKSYIKSYHKLSKFLVILIDILLVHAGYIIAYIIKFNFTFPEKNFMPYYTLIPQITLFTLVLLNIYGLYTITMKTLSEIAFSLGLALMLLQFLTVVSTFFYRHFAFPRSIFIIAFFIQFLLLLGWRGLVLYVFKRVQGVKHVLVIGEMPKAQEFAQKLQNISKGWIDVKYVLEPKTVEELIPYIKVVDTIYLYSKMDENLKSEIVRKAIEFKKHIFIAPDFRDILVSRARVIQFDDVATLSIEQPELTSEQKLIKRVCDILLASVALVISFPIMILIAIAIKLDSEGPVIYRQKRVTEGEREFYVLKFRTMVKDAEKMTGPVLATENDPRITRVGRFLRATRLDELPQLINILKGEMSFIGPRPERPYFVEQFKKLYPEYSLRHNVKAGLTGLAQVYGKYATSPEDKLRLDLIYIKNYSVFLDIKILLLTLKTIFTKEAAEGVKTQK